MSKPSSRANSKTRRASLVKRIWQYAMFLPRFLGEWVRSRDYRTLGFALVPVVVASLAAMLYHTGRTMDFGTVGDEYRASLYQALRADDLESATIYSRRLRLMGLPSGPGELQLAQDLINTGASERGLEIIRRLAPESGGGFGKAHHWLAEYVTRAAASEQRDFSPEEQRYVRQHLEEAVRLEPTNYEAHAMLGRLMLLAGETKAAAAHVKAAVPGQQARRFLLARIYQDLGQETNARREVEAARNYFADAVRRDPADTQGRRFLAQADVLLGNPGRAEQVLTEGYQKTKDEAYRVYLCDLYVAWDRMIEVQDPKNLAGRVALLQRAMALKPDHSATLARVAMLTGRASVEGEADREDYKVLVDRMQDLLVKGKAPATVHLILHLIVGSKATQQEDFEKARFHLQQAYRLNSQIPEVMNNLAWVLANANPPKLDQALELVNQALKLDAARPEFLDTRGQVLLKLKRYEEALSDLELALDTLHGRKELHLALASTYEHLGQVDLAGRHRAIAEKQP